MEKVKYASLGSLGEEFHQAFDHALRQARANTGQIHPNFINGKPKKSRGTFPNTSPVDTRTVLGKFQLGTLEDARKAIAAAKKAFPGWRDLGWLVRVTLLRKAAELMTERQFELAAILTLEVGKNRFEAIAE